MPDLKENLFWSTLGFGLKGLAVALMSVGKKDAMMGRALGEFHGIYRFQNADGNLHRYLVFRGGGRVTALKDYSGEPDFTVTLAELGAFGKGSRPEQVLEMVIANQIGQTGNTQYMYQLGFVLSLLQNYFRNKALKKTMKKASK